MLELLLAIAIFLYVGMVLEATRWMHILTGSGSLNSFRVRLFTLLFPILFPIIVVAAIMAVSFFILAIVVLLVVNSLITLIYEIKNLVIKG
jgi:hypothetical protein